MNVKRLQTLQQVTDFLHGSSGFEPALATKSERYQWIDRPSGISAIHADRRLKKGY